MVNAEQIKYLSRKALRGFAILKDVKFENGIIEYDIATDGSNPTRLTTNNAEDWGPDWSPDGEKIVSTSRITITHKMINWLIPHIESKLLKNMT